MKQHRHRQDLGKSQLESIVGGNTHGGTLNNDDLYQDEKIKILGPKKEPFNEN